MKNSITMIGIALLSGFSSIKAFAQVPEQYLIKNILAYDINEALSSNKSISQGNYLTYGHLDPVIDIVPDNGFTPCLEALSLDAFSVTYPATGYKLMAFYQPKGKFENVSNKHIITISKSDLMAAKDSAVYLIAYNAQIDEVRFISGKMFKHKIWEDFSHKGYTIDNIRDFIRCKTYASNFTDIRFSHKRGKRYYFHGITHMRSKAQIIFNEQHPDLLLVQE